MTQCSKTVYPSGMWGSFHGHQCRITKNVVVRDGKPYCRIHDPAREEAKRQERQEKRDEESREQKEEHRRLIAMHRACGDVSTEVLETVRVKDLLELVQRKENKLRELLKAIKGKEPINHGSKTTDQL